MQKLTDWVTRHPWWTIAILSLLTAFFVSQIPKLHVETDIAAALPQNLPVKRLYDEVSRLFPSREFIFVALQSDDLYSPATIRDVVRLTRELYAIKGVYKVISPTNVKVILGTPTGIAVVPALAGDPADPQVRQQMRERLQNSDFVGNLIARDGKAFGLMVLLKTNADKRAVARAVQQIIERERAEKGLKIYATGRPLIDLLLARGLARDVHVFFTLALLVIVVILLLSFRSLRGVLLPFTVVIAAVLWTFGLMALFRIPFSHSTEFMPVLLISIGIADGIHILNAYYRLSREIKERRQLVNRTMAELNTPVILTSLTTAVAFLSLGVAGVSSIMWLGVTTTIGILTALLFSLTFIPAALALLPLPRRALESRARVLRRALGAYGRGLLTHRALAGGALLLLVLVMLAGYPRLQVENSTLENLPARSEARRAYEFIAEHFAGPAVLTALVEGPPGAVKDPSLLQKLDDFKQDLLQDPGIGGVASLADLIKRLNQVLHGGDPTYYRVPQASDPEEGRKLIAQYFALYQFSSEPGELNTWMTPDGSKTRLAIFLKGDRRSLVYRVDRRARAFIRANFPPNGPVQVELTGTPEIFLAVNDLVVGGQLRSIFVSLLLVVLLVALTFRSAVAGLYGAVPLFFAMLVNFGVMGWLGIYANLENMVASNIAIGVGVDYAIHWLHRYRYEVRKRGRAEGSPLEITTATMYSSGVAILLNALAVAAGFSTISASEFRSVAQMGFLISLAMLSTGFAALTILPLLLARFRPRFLER